MATKRGAKLVRKSTPLEMLAGARILERLREARRLAAAGLTRNGEQVRELLADVMDRLDANTLLQRGCGDSRPESVSSRMAFERGFGSPVGEFLLIPFGEVKVDRPLAGGSFQFTAEQSQAAVKWFEALGRKLAIDYEHQSIETYNTRKDGLRPAAGWIGGLESREDGLWATLVEWTDAARQMLARGEYRYFSPVIYWADEELETLIGLGPVALTNDPAMCGVSALAAGRRKAVQERDEAGTENVDLLTQELAAAQDEVALLSRRLAAQEADAFVERGMRLGKILDSTSMDWRADFQRDAAMAEARLDRAPVVRPPGRILTLDGRGIAAERIAAGRPAWQKWGADALDLAAYERAVQAGRVQWVQGLTSGR